MTITLSIADDKKAELERLAAARGTDLQGFILDAVEEKLEGCQAALYRLPHDEWSKEYGKWVATQHSWNPQFDDSRESIYD